MRHNKLWFRLILIVVLPICVLCNVRATRAASPGVTIIILDDFAEISENRTKLPNDAPCVLINGKVNSGIVAQSKDKEGNIVRFNQDKCIQQYYGDYVNNNKLCAVPFDGTDRSIERAGHGPYHGQAVRHAIDMILSGAASKGMLQNAADIKIISQDVKNFDTTVLVNELQRIVTDVRNQERNRFIVVNMSFSFLPCSVVPLLNEYENAFARASNTDPALQDFQNVVNDLLASEISDKMIDEIVLLQKSGVKCQSFEAPKEQYSLIADLCKLENLSRTISIVAAAGNNPNWTFPTIPALWNGILAVSACDDDAFLACKGGIASWSNRGDVIAPGNLKFNGIVRQGTSFAAPRISALMAVYLATQGDPCHTPISVYTMKRSGIGGAWNNVSPRVVASASPSCQAMTDVLNQLP